MNLLREHGALGYGRFQGIGRDLGNRARLVELGAGSKAFLRELFLALEFGLCCICARLQAENLGIERLHAQREFLIGDDGDHIARLHFAVLLDIESGNRAARSHPGKDFIGASHGGVDGFEIVDLALLDLENVLSLGASRACMPSARARALRQKLRVAAAPRLDLSSVIPSREPIMPADARQSSLQGLKILPRAFHLPNGY